MRLTGVSLLIPENSLINVQRVNQSLARRIRAFREDQQSLKKDSINISPQGRVASIIQNLTKQKMNINDRKGQVIASALENGQSMETIQSQLDSYDEQIKNIDKQISEITAQQVKGEIEKQHSKVQDNHLKTKEDIQSRKLANITKMSMSLDKIDTIDAVKTKVDGNIDVLKSEIKVDKIRAEGMTGSMESIEKKEDLLSEMETQSLDLIEGIGEQLSNISKIIDANNNLASNQPTEEIDVSQLDDIINENNGKVPNPEWKPIKSLEGEGTRGSLTGKNLSEGKRLDGWEVTHVQSGNPDSTAQIKPKEPIKVVHSEERHYLRSTEQYFSVFEQYAKGQISEDEFIAYSSAFDSIVGSTLNTRGVSGIRNLVKEMKENLAKGIANTPDNLKTELYTGGMKVTWKELMNMQKTGEYIDRFFGGAGPGSYDTYAKIGIARAYIYKPGLGLTEDQIHLLREAVEKKIAKKLEHTRLAIEDAAADIQNLMWEGYYIGGTRTMPVASNTKLISEITEAFSKIDPNDKSTYDAAVDRFQELMRPWETTFASYVARQAPGYASSYVQEKEHNSRASYQAIWNGTY